MDTIATLMDTIATKSTDHYGKKDLEKFAKAKGLVMVYPTDHELQIDIESQADYEVFKKHFAVLLEQSWKIDIQDAPSRNKPEGRHITLRVLNKKFTQLERLLLQAVLGSDRMRELLCYFDKENGNGDTTFFFE